jgi:hypothetical protein
MARSLSRLNALLVSRASTNGLYADGGGLYLQVGAGGAKSWIFRYKFRGRVRDMGLGPFRVVTLAEARKRAGELRLLRSQGVDPVEARKAQYEKAKLDAAAALTFRDCAIAYFETHRASWQNVKHAAQWPSSLETYTIHFSALCRCKM